MNDRDRLRDTIADLLNSVRQEDEDGTVERLRSLAEGTDDLCSATCELATANLSLLDERAPSMPAGGGTPIGIELRAPSGATIDIDVLEPSMRAAVRVLLAVAHEHPTDARVQLEIVAENEPDDLIAVFLHMASWTMALLDLGDEVEARVPHWLRHLTRH